MAGALLLAPLTWTQTIFSEDFDGIPGATTGGAGTYAFPNGWLLRNVDNASPNTSVSYVNQAWVRREDFKFNVSDSAALSTSYYSPSGSADDWMWTPLIGPLPANSELTWNAVAYDPSYLDGYEVRIMTQSSTPGGPTGGSGAIGNQVTNSTVLFSTASESSAWTSHSVNLATYAGESVWIAFRNNSSDKFILVIDDIEVSAMSNYDAELTATAELSEYTQIPLPQNPSFVLEGNVSNNGAQDITNVMLQVDVYNSANTQVFSSSSAPTTITAGANMTLTTSTTFAPAVADTFSFVYHVTIDETDEDGTNDSLTTSIIITDSTFARDNENTNGTIGIGAGDGYIGQTFHIDTQDTLTSVTLGFNGGYTNQSITALIWDMASGTPNQVIGYTDTIPYSTTAAAVYTVPMNDELILAPGDYVITAVEFDSTLQLIRTTEKFTPGTVWTSWTGQPWTNAETFGSTFAHSVYLRANFGNTLHCNDVTVTVDTTICYGESLTVGTSTYTVSGNYSDTLASGACDSIVITNLTVLDSIPTAVSVSSNSQTASVASVPGASYQWINCSDNSPVSGANDSTFTTNITANFAVVITVNNCTDTSECVSLTEETGGLNELQAAAGFRISPNPAKDRFVIFTPVGGRFVLLNAAGEELSRFSVATDSELEISVEHLAPGLYFVKNTDSFKTQKLVIR